MIELKRLNVNPPERFTDGKMFFGTIKTERVNGKKVGEVFNVFGELYFNRMTIRQSDYSIESASEQTIDLKIKTFFTRGISKNSHKVLIGEEMFDIYSIDSDVEEKYNYWYLTKVGRFDGTRNVAAEETT